MNAGETLQSAINDETISDHIVAVCLYGNAGERKNKAGLGKFGYGNDAVKYCFSAKGFGDIG